ncbi:MAG: enoyl-CoA hydratase/isomerase family protein [Caulobacteraceae bacterium]|nr:enoyl-CoA hydratase/isomerase family protein [Caulobacteraceae bacterium]
MTEEAPILFERDGPIARLTLNRPSVGNAIDIPMSQALLKAVIECDEDDAVRCVVITGAGRLFCAGGDVGAFAGAGEGLPGLLKELTSYLHSAISRLARMNKPLVVAVNGPAAGAGFSLALLGDIVLTAPGAHFTLAYAGIGFSPDGGATWLLPRLIGLRRAQELALTNKRSTAEEAAAMGLVTRVVEAEALASEATAVAQAIAASAVGALGRTRNLLLSSFGNTLETHLELEARSIAEASRTAEGREGVRAFLEKRKPDFKG